MPSDPNEFFGQEQRTDLDRPLDKTVNHADLIGSGYTPHEDIDGHIEEMHDWSTRYVCLGEVINSYKALSLSGSGDVNYTDLDLSSYCTPNTYAVNLRLSMHESGSATNLTYVRVRKNGSSGYAAMRANGHHINDKANNVNGICKCDENQVIEYSVGASGAATAIVSIYVLGYFEYIYKPFKE